MSEYGFVINVTISLSVDVEADTLEAAMDLARSAGVKSLCHQCANHEPGVWCTSGELDCDPTSSELVDLFVDGEEQNVNKLKAATNLWGGS
jgi:hypothetical protein